MLLLLPSGRFSDGESHFTLLWSLYLDAWIIMLDNNALRHYRDWRGNGVAHINEVTLRRAGLVLGWATVRGFTILVFNQPPRHTQPGHRSSVGRRNEYWRWSRPLLGEKRWVLRNRNYGLFIVYWSSWWKALAVNEAGRCGSYAIAILTEFNLRRLKVTQREWAPS